MSRAGMPRAHVALVAELHRHGLRLLNILAQRRYSRSRYYRRLHQLGGPRQTSSSMIADETGLSRRLLLEACGLI
jgi:hypothetical protein